MSQLGHAEMAFGAILTALATTTGFTPRGRDCRCPCRGHTHDDAAPSGRIWIDEQRNLVRVSCYRGHRWEEWVAALGVPRCYWFLKVTEEARGYEGPRVPEIVARHRYEYADGREAYTVVRTNPKGFWQERPYKLDTGEELRLFGLKAGWYKVDRGQWRWHGDLAPSAGVNAIYAEDAERVLYRLVELNDSPLEEPVYFLEGEKKCDLIRSLGCVATTTAQGAANFHPGVCRPLAGRHVVVVPDNNRPGYKHAACVAGSAVMCRAASVRVVFWKKGEIAPDQDFGDWFNANDWPDYDRVRKRFYQGSQPFGVLPTDPEGNVLEVADAECG